MPITAQSIALERLQDRCALSIFNARSPLLGVGSTWVYALGYSNPETAIASGIAMAEDGSSTNPQAGKEIGDESASERKI